MIPPVIKWSGSKRAVAAQLARLFPPSHRFFDPFVGGGAILPHRVGTPGIAGDVINELVSLWEQIKRDPHAVADGYQTRWTRLQEVGHTAFYDIRSRFNAARDPVDLLFLSRTCVNGLIRFNARGEFNNSLHHTRPGVAPDRLRRILLDWSRWLSDVVFVAADYRDTLASARRGDFVFLDPPYAANRGRYQQGGFELPAFFAELERLNSLGARWMLTFDGAAGERNYARKVPPELYRHSFAIATGNSPFPRLQNAQIDAVTESVFLNFEPLPEPHGQFPYAA